MPWLEEPDKGMQLPQIDLSGLGTVATQSQLFLPQKDPLDFQRTLAEVLLFHLFPQYHHNYCRNPLGYSHQEENGKLHWWLSAIQVSSDNA
jgi:hypothetical protein